MLTTGMKDRLAAFVRGEFESCAERDWELEAS
jgi:hypothetical protein